ncbi:MAG: ABC transporter substrate binding protein [Hylemonella sp.]|uniref:ABC transporter substrate-binding protein n=1 Tax=Hylemonella sp. TaxID=2066020 RepID=UPI0022BFC8C8|nr:ABC transporter substrate binding protein [Hylemonella sp.]MCZ8251506.1 ABC transporter substrate binding protein [Hylemonella sp.]
MRLAPLSLLVLLAFLALGARANEVLLVSSERSPAYQEAADAVVAELARREVLQLQLAELPTYSGAGPRLYVALGTEACSQLAQQALPAPVLCTLLPRASFERVLRESGRRAGASFSALYLNQPPGRQLDLIRLALPQARRVGVLWGPDSVANEAALEAAAQARGLRMVGVPVRPEEPVFAGLKKILDESDVLLALADPQIYNSNSIQNILLTSFRAQVPMLAFSPAYVRAGALMAVHSTPRQIGQQAGVLARGVLQGQPLGQPQFPLQFDVSVNEHVARSLGLRLDAANLTERLRRLERGP